MNRKWIAVSLAMLFFVIGFLVSLDQYFSIGIWFQLRDLHHETFALSSFTLAIGILIGSSFATKEK
jgi:hypothetical protein